MSPFPWTYDQLQRFAVLRLLAAEWSRDAGPEGLRILDVGGTAADRPGAGVLFPAGESPADPASHPPPRVQVAGIFEDREPGSVRGSGPRLPFPDGSFDIVTAFDVLERVPDADRNAFLAEMSRVASRAVLLGSPTKSPGVEQAEALLNAETLRLSGTERDVPTGRGEHGLPRPEDIEAGLARAGLAAVSFGYGALSTWLSYHVFRASFILRRESNLMTEEIDRYWAGQPQAAELEAPFYRRFWIASKTMGREEMERTVETIKKHLREGLAPILKEIVDLGPGSPASRPPADDFETVEQTARRVLSRPSVSALIVTNGEPSILGPCLDALLTQAVDIDLETAVWIFRDRPDTAAWLEAHYPQVRKFKGGGPVPAEALRGDRIFLVDEKFQPAPDAAARYVARTEAAPPDAVLAVSAPWRGGFPASWKGRARSSWKKSRGLMIKAGVIGRTSQIREEDALVPRFNGWVIGDGLFFRRIALSFRKDAPAPDRNTVFLWEFK